MREQVPMEVKTPSESGNEAPLNKAVVKQEGLWVLEKADSLSGEIAQAPWLIVASIWRLPIALLKRDSLNGLEAGVAGRRILPPRITMLTAALASALFLSFLLDTSPNDAIAKLSSASPEAWIAVAAPALISLWLVLLLTGEILRIVAGRESPDPQPSLTQAVSSVAILSCIGTLAIGLSEPWMNSIRKGLPDELIMVGLACTGLYLGYTGWNTARQVAAELRGTEVRR
jgi:hypothetical protein